MKNVDTFIKGLNLMKSVGLDETYFMFAEHDVVYFSVDLSQLPEDSEEGKKLIEYGFVCSEEGWMYRT